MTLIYLALAGVLVCASVKMGIVAGIGIVCAVYLMMPYNPR